MPTNPPSVVTQSVVPVTQSVSEESGTERGNLITFIVIASVVPVILEQREESRDEAWQSRNVYCHCERKRGNLVTNAYFLDCRVATRDSSLALKNDSACCSSQ